jgi:hypothetical protein
MFITFFLNIFKKQPKKPFSYGMFMIKNPKATKKERQEAIKKFLDSTR